MVDQIIIVIRWGRALLERDVIWRERSIKTTHREPKNRQTEKTMRQSGGN